MECGEAHCGTDDDDSKTDGKQAETEELVDEPVQTVEHSLRKETECEGEDDDDE